MRLLVVLLCVVSHVFSQTISSVEPTSVSSSGGHVLTLVGTGFSGTTTARLWFAATSTAVALSVSNFNATALKVTTPLISSIDAAIVSPGTTFSVQVGTGVTFNPSGTPITVFPAPKEIALLPRIVPNDGGANITVVGLNLSPGVQLGLFDPSTGNLLGAATGTLVNGNTAFTVLSPSLSGFVGRLSFRISGNGVHFEPETFDGESFGITSLVPSAVPLAGLATLTVVGSNFASGGSAYCKIGTVVSSATLVDDTTVLCNVPATTSTATVPLELGLSGSSTTGFSADGVSLAFYQDPAVSLVVPASGPVTGGFTVTIYGTNIAPNSMTAAHTRCQFYSTTGSSSVAGSLITGGPANYVTCTAPAAPCDFELAVKATLSLNGANYAAGGATFNYFALISVRPNQFSPSSTITITGNNFAAAGANTTATCRVAGDTTVSPATIVSATVVTCAVAANTTRGISGSILISLDSGTTYSLPGSSPSVALLNTYSISTASPLFGRAEGNTVVSINGTGFITTPAAAAAQAACLFGGIKVSATVISSTLITCLTPPGFAATPVLFSPNNGDETVQVSSYSYFGLTGILPAIGPATGGTQVTVTGFGFSSNAANLICLFDSQPGKIAFARNDLVICESPVAQNPAGATVDLKVSSNNGVEFSTRQFTYYATPQITRVVPDSGPQSGGTVVSLLGTNYLPNTIPLCYFGDIQIRDVAVIPGGVTCRAPPGNTAVIPRISFNGDNYHSAPKYSYYTFFSFAPLSGPLSGGTVMTIFGDGFSLNPSFNATCKFNNFIVPATVVSPQAMTCVAPVLVSGPVTTLRVLRAQPRTDFALKALQSSNSSGAPTGSMDLTLLVSLNGGSDYTPASSASAGSAGTVFVAYVPPSLAEINPRNGPTIGNFKVTVTGDHFTDVPQQTTCRFGTRVALASTFVSSSRIICVAPAGPLSTVDVTLSSNGQDYTAPVPAGVFEYSGCPPGKYSPAFDQPCLDCPAGYFNPIPNQSNCTLCTETGFSAAGSTNCTTCPENTRAYPGADRQLACQCLDTFYRPTRNMPDGACVPCPAGAVCTGDDIEPKPGYYKDPVNANNFVQCEPASLCTGAGDCRKGHTGYLCRECLDGFYHSGLLCEPCPKNSKLLLIAVFIVGALGVFLLIYLAGDAQVPYSATLLMVTSFAQTVTMSLNIELNWPDLLKDVKLGFTGPYTLDFALPECSFELTWEIKWIMSIISPAIIALGFFLVWFVGVTYIRILRMGKPTNWTGPSAADRQASWFVRTFKTPYPRAMITNRVFNGFLLFLLCAYTMLVRDTLSFFACSKISGKYILDANAQYECYSSWWWSRFPIALLGLLVYVVGTPCVCAWIFFARKRAGGRLEFFQRFGMIYRHYHKNYVYWELIVCVRKIAIVIGSLFFTQCPLCQLAFQVFFIVNTGLYHSFARPFNVPRHNSIESTMLGLNCLIVLAGVTFSQLDLPQGGKKFIEWLCILVTAGGCCSLILFWILQIVRPPVVKKKKVREEDKTNAENESMQVMAQLGFKQVDLGRASTGNFTEIHVEKKGKESSGLAVEMSTFNAGRGSEVNVDEILSGDAMSSNAGRIQPDSKLSDLS